MRSETQITKNREYLPNVFEEAHPRSEAIDLNNARRFKQLVSRPDNRNSSQQKFGLPFAIERPEAAAAHRELEQELKPAAKVNNSGVRFSAGGSFDGIPKRVSANLFMTLAGFCSLLCAYAISRSFK